MLQPLNLSDRFSRQLHSKIFPEQKMVVCKRGNVLSGPDISFKIARDYQGADIQIRSTYPVIIYKYFVGEDYPKTDSENKYEVGSGEYEGFYDASSDLREGEKIEVLDFLTEDNVATVYLERRNPLARLTGYPHLLVGKFG